MSDLINNFPSWGETGTFPSDGFFYDGGDQVNEKHFDALWNGIDVHVSNLNTAIRDRVRDISGDIILDGGVVASTGSGTREVDVTASSAGAYVDGEKVSSVSSTTLTHTTNGTGSLRTDVIYLQTDGTLAKSENTTSPPSGTLKVAEVDVTTSDTIDDVRNYARDHTYDIASENAPSNPQPGDEWYDLTNSVPKVYANGSWHPEIASVSDDGTTQEDYPAELNFGANLSVSVSGGTVTITGAGNTDTTTDVSEDGSTVVNQVTDINFTGSTAVTDDGDGTVTVEAIENYSTKSNVSGLTEGDVVYIEDENQLYVEDGT